MARSNFSIDLDEYEIAERFYALPADKRTYKELVNQLRSQGNRLEDKYAKVIRDLEVKGAIKHTVIRKNAQFLPRINPLENKLRHHFALRQCIVVDISTLYSNLDPKKPDWSRYDNSIHEHLGAWAGRVLASCVRPNDNIAIGSGRGPAYAIRNCNFGSALMHSGMLFPLTGQMSTHTWFAEGEAGNETLYLDADNVATLLHTKLGSKVKVSSPNCAITAKRKLTDPTKANVAIVGIGALGGGHRLKKYQILDDIMSVRQLVEELNNECEAIEKQFIEYKQPFYHPVGDVCNWYFLVDTPPPAELSPTGKKHFDQIQKKIDTLNKQFLNTTPGSLSKIANQGVVIAIAGGPYKAYAIRHVLNQNKEFKRNGGPWITHLITDNITADWMIKQDSKITL